MERLLLLAFVGLVAQFVDGSLGMAYGLTSASLLVALGYAPALVSATVHTAELATTFTSGFFHSRFGNTDWRIVLLLGVPGAIGAFAGATVLSNVPGELARPYVAGVLFTLGVILLWRFTFLSKSGGPAMKRLVPKRLLFPLGFVAGFFDASGGGGWGPITTPTLLVQQHTEPRKVVGSVDTSEFAVSLSATAAFLIMLGPESINLTWLGALVLGGLIAAPVAAWLVGRVPRQLLGVLIAGVILVSNARTLSGVLQLTPEITVAAYLALMGLWLGALAFLLLQGRRASFAGPGVPANS